jgi:hypothetical protein
VATEIVVSGQTLPRKDDCELVAAGGAVVTARIAGRDLAANRVGLFRRQSLASLCLAFELITSGHRQFDSDAYSNSDCAK